MPKLINELELSAWLGQSVLTIRRNRTTHPERHPPYKKIGSSVRYDQSEVQKWLDSQTINGLETSTPSKVQLLSPPRGKRGRPSKVETVRKTKNAGK